MGSSSSSARRHAERGKLHWGLGAAARTCDGSSRRRSLTLGRSSPSSERAGAGSSGWRPASASAHAGGEARPHQSALGWGRAPEQDLGAFLRRPYIADHGRRRSRRAGRRARAEQSRAERGEERQEGAEGRTNRRLRVSLPWQRTLADGRIWLAR
ncbi:hypothetical protein PVAP13_9NG529300 [Panicum virgatum]|uniref:Uncharacterized protein n=1 Tax=Panicum virgatum TaxID=38727 RepID=A0A8T0MYM8_PANVG|nr:hypothetical protein PVAP13_9NG529300 [Panicum virgatum]